MATTSSSSYTLAIPSLPKLSTYHPMSTSMTLPKARTVSVSALSPTRSSLSQIQVNSSSLSTSHSTSPRKPRVSLPSLTDLIDAPVAELARQHSPVANISRAREGDYVVKNDGVFELRTKPRRKTSPQELAALEKNYLRNPLPSMADRMALSRELDMPARSIQIWFQNRRQTEKKKTLAAPAAAVAVSSQDAPWHDVRTHKRETEAAPLDRRHSQTTTSERPHLHRSHSGSLEQLLQARERSFGPATSSTLSRRTQHRSLGPRPDSSTMLDLMESDPPSMGLEELEDSSSDVETESDSESIKRLPLRARTVSGRDERRSLAHPYRPNSSIGMIPMQRRTASLDRVATSSYPKPVRYFAPVSTTRQVTPTFSRSPSVASSGEMMVATPEVSQVVECEDEVLGLGKEDEEAMRAAGALLALWGA